MSRPNYGDEAKEGEIGIRNMLEMEPLGTAVNVDPCHLRWGKF